MAKYAVTIKHGNPGQPKSSSQVIYVECESEDVARELAKTNFKNSNSTYRDKEVDVVAIKKV